MLPCHLGDSHALGTLTSSQTAKPRAHSRDIRVPDADCVGALPGHSLPLAELVSVDIGQERSELDLSDIDPSLTGTNGKGDDSLPYRPILTEEETCWNEGRWPALLAGWTPPPVSPEPLLCFSKAFPVRSTGRLPVPKLAFGLCWGAAQGLRHSSTALHSQAVTSRSSAV